MRSRTSLPTVRSFLALALGASIAAAATAAHAAPPSKEGRSEGREARLSWQRGKRALAAGRHAEAEEALCRAMDLSPVPQHVLDCGRALASQEKWLDAEDVLAPWIDDDTGLTPREAHAIRELWKTVEAGASRERKIARSREEKSSPRDAEDPEEAPPSRASDGGGGTIWPGAITLAGSGLALGVGAVFGVMAATTASDVRSRCEGDVCPAHVADDAQQSATFGDVSTASFVVGGALAVGGVALLFAFAGDDEGDASARSQPKRGHAALFVGPSAAGVRGRF